MPTDEPERFRGEKFLNWLQRYAPTNTPGSNNPAGEFNDCFRSDNITDKVIFIEKLRITTNLIINYLKGEIPRNIDHQWQPTGTGLALRAKHDLLQTFQTALEKSDINLFASEHASDINLFAPEHARAIRLIQTFLTATPKEGDKYSTSYKHAYQVISSITLPTLTKEESTLLDAREVSTEKRAAQQKELDQKRAAQQERFDQKINELLSGQTDLAVQIEILKILKKIAGTRSINLETQTPEVLNKLLRETQEKNEDKIRLLCQDIERGEKIKNRFNRAFYFSGSVMAIAMVLFLALALTASAAYVYAHPAVVVAPLIVIGVFALITCTCSTMKDIEKNKIDDLESKVKDLNHQNARLSEFLPKYSTTQHTHSSALSTRQPATAPHDHPEREPAARGAQTEESAVRGDNLPPATTGTHTKH